MRTLPSKMVQLLAPFAPLFSKRVWQNTQLLLVVLTAASTIMAT
jgi:leucyl-tRNA synthetase